MEIRPVEISDAGAVAEIRRQDGVRDAVMALSSERTEAVTGFITSLTARDRVYVAEENGEIVGLALMLAKKEESRAHCASVTVMVHADRQGRGIGSKLLKHLIERADEELGFRRLELLVLTTNERAIKLYKKFGFAIEATRKNAAATGGRFADEYLMGRIRPEDAA